MMYSFFLMKSDANLKIFTFDIDMQVIVLLFPVLLSFERNKVFNYLKIQTKAKF